MHRRIDELGLAAFGNGREIEENREEPVSVLRRAGIDVGRETMATRGDVLLDSEGRKPITLGKPCADLVP